MEEGERNSVAGSRKASEGIREKSSRPAAAIRRHASASFDLAFVWGVN